MLELPLFLAHILCMMDLFAKRNLLSNSDLQINCLQHLQHNKANIRVSIKITKLEKGKTSFKTEKI
jgi:hypothetical protein